MLPLKNSEATSPVLDVQEPPAAATMPVRQRDERCLSIRLQRELTRRACGGFPVTYGLLLRSLGIAAEVDAAPVRTPLERLMDEDVIAGRPFVVALAVSPGSGGRPAPWFFEKARTAGRLAALADELEAFAFHAKELQRAISYYRALSRETATSCGDIPDNRSEGARKMLTARGIMTTNVIAVQSDATVGAVADILVTQGISGVPVLKNDRLVGIVSEGDLMHRAEIGTGAPAVSWWARIFRDNASLAAQYTREHSTRVADVMTREVATVVEGTPIAEIADLLERRKIRRVPVTRNGKVVGIVSRSNIVRALAVTANLPSRASGADDETVRQHIRTALLEQAWPSAGAINFTVRNGVASFWGTVDSDAERNASRVLCENVPGVRAVEDHRVLVDYPAIGV
jgi:CBS domain-containing protein